MQGLSLVVVAALAAAACSGAPAAVPASWSRDLAATVNGVALTSADVAQASTPAASTHGAPPAASEPEVVATLVREELAAQRALELGIDLAPADRSELDRLEAQARAFRRHRLAEALYARELAGLPPVTDADARAYFDAHAAELRREQRVYQILARDEAAVTRAAEALAAGVPFEEVAARLVPPAAGGERMPWDLGYLRWNQVPAAWRASLAALRPGETSPVIRGANRRFWIVKLVDRREDPAITFAVMKDVIVARLRDDRAADARTRLDADLARGSRIVRRAP